MEVHMGRPRINDRMAKVLACIYLEGKAMTVAQVIAVAKGKFKSRESASMSMLSLVRLGLLDRERVSGGVAYKFSISQDLKDAISKNHVDNKAAVKAGALVRKIADSRI